MKLKRLQVALGTTLLTLFVVELGFRGCAWQADKNDLERAMADEPPLPADGQVSLVHLLRPSTNPSLVYEQRPDMDVSYKQMRVRTNGAGFRDRDYEPEKSDRTVRIVGLGDSIMWGWRVREADAFMSKLETSLNKGRPGKRWDVINTAVNGYNTAMEVESLAAKGLAYDPDLVLVAFCHNDLDLPNYVRQEQDYFALDRSFAWDALAHRLEKKRLEQDPGRPNVLSTIGLAIAPMAEDGVNFENDPRKVPERYKHLVGWPAFETALERLAELAESEDFEVAMVFFRPQETPVKERGMEKARGLGFCVIDTGPLERQWLEDNNYPVTAYKRSPLVFGPDDLHPTALLHELTAELIERDLDAAGVLARLAE